jgi:hypothetical protein
VTVRALIACAAAALLALPAHGQQKFSVTCPIGGERFSFQDPPPLQSHETYLDQRPTDPAHPWPHAKCPGNGFVVYKSSFSSAELARLSAIVASEKYRALAAAHTTHYLEAVLRRELGDSPYAVAWALVQASWEASGDPARYKQYAGEALAAYDSIPLNALPEIRHRILKRMLSAELARRLGQFDSARDRLLEMRDAAELSKPFFQRIVELQLKLVRAKDTGEHRVPY